MVRAIKGGGGGEREGEGCTQPWLLHPCNYLSISRMFRVPSNFRRRLLNLS